MRQLLCICISTHSSYFVQHVTFTCIVRTTIRQSCLVVCWHIVAGPLHLQRHCSCFVHSMFIIVVVAVYSHYGFADFMVFVCSLFYAAVVVVVVVAVVAAVAVAVAALGSSDKQKHTQACMVLLLYLCFS